MYIFPPETISTTSTIAFPSPEEATAPTIIPAEAIATATVTIFIPPRIIPEKISKNPAFSWVVNVEIVSFVRKSKFFKRMIAIKAKIP